MVAHAMATPVAISLSLDLHHPIHYLPLLGLKILTAIATVCPVHPPLLLFTCLSHLSSPSHFSVLHQTFHHSTPLKPSSNPAPLPPSPHHDPIPPHYHQDTFFTFSVSHLSQHQPAPPPSSFLKPSPIFPSLSFSLNLSTQPLYKPSHPHYPPPSFPHFSTPSLTPCLSRFPPSPHKEPPIYTEPDTTNHRPPPNHPPPLLPVRGRRVATSEGCQPRIGRLVLGSERPIKLDHGGGTHEESEPEGEDFGCDLCLLCSCCSASYGLCPDPIVALLEVDCAVEVPSSSRSEGG